jgi:DNA-binding MarR family transcriptional regulator
LKPLERQGFVEVRPGDADKRQRVLALTTAGRGVLAAAVPIWLVTHRAIEGLLGEASPDRLRADLLALS